MRPFYFVVQYIQSVQGSLGVFRSTVPQTPNIFEMKRIELPFTDAPPEFLLNYGGFY